MMDDQESARTFGSTPVSSDVEEATEQQEDSGNISPRRCLSTVSKYYDRGNKGYLDDTETKMRQLDRSNRGHLDNAVVYDMIRESNDIQRQMVTQRWLILGLTSFAVLLAVANAGTAFAAAWLAKDTTVTDSGDLAYKHDGQRVGTTAKGESFALSHPMLNTDEAARRLLSEVHHELSSFNTIPVLDAVHLWTAFDVESTPVRLGWGCGLDGVGVTVSGAVESGSRIDYTNATDTGKDGTMYTYDVKVLGESQTIEIDCVDGAFDCIVEGTRCCIYDSDCGAGNVCAQCGCQCQPEGFANNRCDSGCAEGYSNAIPMRG